MAEVPIDLHALYRIEDPSELVWTAAVIERVQETRRAINERDRRELEAAKRRRS